MTSTTFDVPLESIATCFEGERPAAISTLGADGGPNVTYLSVVHRIDESHVALSRQFFNKTDKNTLADPRAQIELVEPDTGRQFILSLVYERTETSGPLLERMKTNLDAVASHEGMTGIFALRGVDVCRVTACTMVPCDFPGGPPERKTPGIELIDTLTSRIGACDNLGDLLDESLRAAADLFGYDHGFIMFADETAERLYTVASHGTTSSGTGSEVRIGEGIIGVAAARRQPVRLANITQDLGYTHAIRQSIERAHRDTPAQKEIPLPGLANVVSQVVVPMLAFGKLVGVLCFQSETPGRFRAADEHLVGVIARHTALGCALLRTADAATSDEDHTSATSAIEPLNVKYYLEDDSIFLDNEYLIKGVAGRILWRLLTCYRDEGRVEFSNKEIRLDPALDLPDIKDNLEARLILLTRRLKEREASLRIEKTGRGRFRLRVARPIVLQEVAPQA